MLPYNINPFQSPQASAGESRPRRHFVVMKISLCIVGLFLFCLNPWRTLWFYERVAAHEGFGTTQDTYIIGVAFQSIATIVLFPVAFILITYGIGKASRISLTPRFNRFTKLWGSMACVLALTMLLIEGDMILYCLHFPHHVGTIVLTLLNVFFIYVWWCCSIAHAPPPPNDNRLSRVRLEPTKAYDTMKTRMLLSFVATSLPLALAIFLTVLAESAPQALARELFLAAIPCGLIGASGALLLSHLRTCENRISQLERQLERATRNE